MTAVANKKKLLVLASWFPKNETDSTGRFIIDQANAMKEIKDSLGNSVFDVRIVDCSIRLPFIPKQVQNWLKMKQIIEVMNSENFIPDTIWAHVSFPAGVIGIKLKKAWPQSKLILTEHCGPLSLLEPYFTSKQTFDSHFSNYDQIVAVSSTLANEIQSRNSNVLVSVIGNFVHDDFFHASGTQPIGPNHCCFIGRCTKEKGFDLLIQTLEEYDSKYSDPLVVHILGEGPLLPNLLNRKFTHIEVVYEGTGGRNTVISVLRKSAFLLLTSRYETFSLVAAEAIVMGRRVIGFKCGGPEDFVRGETGILISDFSFIDLANNIENQIKSEITINSNFFKKVDFQSKYLNIFSTII